MYNTIAGPIKDTLHLVIDYAVPKNELIAISSAAVGLYAHRLIRWHGPQILTELWNGLWQKETSLWDKLVTGPTAGLEAVDYSAHYIGVGVGVATSLVLNVIAEGIFKIKERKTLDAKKESLISHTFFQRPLNFAELRSLAESSLPSKLPSPAKVEVVPLIPEIVVTPPIQPASPAKEPASRPSSSPVREHKAPVKENEPWEHILDEMETPCCGQFFSLFKGRP